MSDGRHCDCKRCRVTAPPLGAAPPLDPDPYMMAPVGRSRWWVPVVCALAPLVLTGVIIAIMLGVCR